jgi:hypothetical protein
MKTAKPFTAQFGLAADSNLPNHGLLRGVAVEYIGPRDRARPLRFSLTLPTVPIPGAIADDKPVEIVLGRTLPLDAGLDIRPQQVDAVWNRSPHGNWAIGCNERLQALGVTDVALHIWLVYS